MPTISFSAQKMDTVRDQHIWIRLFDYFLGDL